MDFETFWRVAETMSLSEIRELAEAKGSEKLVSTAQEFYFSADPVADFRKMLAADIVMLHGRPN